MKSLSISKKFFKHLNIKNINYCHWKSNFRLKESLAGKTDLDLLVDKKSKKQFNIVLKNLKFKKIVSPKSKKYPGMEDYLGFDYMTGELIHLHVHYQLILGEKHVKNYHIPVENVFFNNLFLQSSVKVPQKELEIIIFVIRSILKLSFKDIIVQILKRNFLFFPQAIIDEYEYLLNKMNTKKMNDIYKQLNIHISFEKLIKHVNKMKIKEMNVFSIIKLKIHIKSRIKQYKLKNNILINFKKILICIKRIRVVSKVFPVKRKTVEKNGKTFSLVGADGSGKSSFQKDLSKWLSWKLEVRMIYFGIPKNKIVKLAGLLHNISNSIAKLINYKFGIKYLVEFLNSVRWVYIAKKRLSYFKLSKLYIKKGFITITDRYPMKKFYKMKTPMDGPRISKETKLKKGILSDYESTIYKKIQMPTKVLLLKTNIKELRKRKTDLDYNTHLIKSNAVNSISGKNIIKIDNNKKYNQVLLQLKRIIWENI